MEVSLYPALRGSKSIPLEYRGKCKLGGQLPLNARLVQLTIKGITP
jgi:hypothetical protein